MSVLPTCVVVVALAVAGGAAQVLSDPPPRPTDHLIGVWRLNLSKSTYRPGPPPTSETRTYVRNGDNVEGTILRAFADGRRDRIEYVANFDREYPVLGTDDYDHIVLKRLDEWTSEAVLSHAGRVYGLARREIARAGTTMTITFRRDNNPDVSVYNVAVYDRLQSADPGRR